MDTINGTLISATGEFDVELHLTQKMPVKGWFTPPNQDIATAGRLGPAPKLRVEQEEHVIQIDSHDEDGCKIYFSAVDA